MRVTLSLSQEAIDLYRKQRISGKGRLCSRFLADSFIKRGHELKLIDPLKIYEKNNQIFAKESLNFNKYVGGFYGKTENYPLSGDVFFVYNLGEQEGPNVSENFLKSLYSLENQYFSVLNSAESTSYEFKPKQKSLDLPWIPEFKVKSKSNLISLLKSGKQIIAKPVIGLGGQGIVFLNDLKKVDFIFKKGLSNFFYEQFVPADEERRYIFLDNQYVIGRKCGKFGLPGEEHFSSVNLMEGIPKEIELARKIVKDTGMFFCAVDFRGDYLLEINGSGTGVAPPDPEEVEQLDIYNLSGPVVMAVEKHIQDKILKIKEGK